MAYLSAVEHNRVMILAGKTPLVYASISEYVDKEEI